MDREETLSFGKSRITEAVGPDDLLQVVHELRSRFEVAHLAYHTVRAPRAGEDENIMLGTADPAWCARYIDRGYIEIDPAIKEVRRTALPTDWDTLDRSSARLQQYFKDLDSYEIGRRGFTIPCFSVDGELGIISFSTNHTKDVDWKRFTLQKAPDIAFLGQQLHIKALSFEAKSISAGRLTPQGRRLLSLFAQGHQPKAIAHMTDLSIHTVRMHLDKAQARLGCRTKAEAVRKALDLGLISGKVKLAVAVFTPLTVYASLRDGMQAFLF